MVLCLSLVVALKAVLNRWDANTVRTDFKHWEATLPVVHWFFPPPGESVLWVRLVCSMMSTMLRDVLQRTQKQSPAVFFSLVESAVPVEFHFLLAGKMRAGEEEKILGVLHANVFVLFSYLLLRRGHVVLYQIGVKIGHSVILNVGQTSCPT